MAPDGRDGHRVCVVTPGYISSTPRVVREADALTAAGFDVRVIFAQGQLEEIRGFDAAVLKDRRWRSASFGWSSGRSQERWDYYRSGIRHRLADMMTRGGVAHAAVIDRAEGRVYPELAALAGAEPADLFIGHYPSGLAAAAWAAKRHGARLGYDVEDLYADTYPISPAWERARGRILDIEHRYVPGCAHISAVSRPVAAAFQERYQSRPPVLVHNCHPWGDRDSMDGQILDRQGPELSLFWFSQTVGLDRGLQQAIRAIGLSGAPVQLHIRGSVTEEVRGELVRLATLCGAVSSLHFHPICAPGELLSRAAEHDVGLALETDDALNRRLTVTNKLFLYLTAGLAVAATDLPGQRGVLETCPAAAQLHAPDDASTLAEHLRTWARDPDALARAKRAALDAARTSWNAEGEGRRVVSAVSTLLGNRPPHALASGE